MLGAAGLVALGCKGEPQPEPQPEPKHEPKPAADPIRPPPGPGWCSPDGWCWLSPQPHGVELRGVWAHGPDDVWAVGEGAMVVRWDGTAWVRVELGIDPQLELNDIWASSPERLFIAAQDGSILSFDRRSTPLAIERHQPIEMPMRSLWGSSAQDVYAVAYDSQLFHFDGSAWTSIDPAPLETAKLVRGSATNDVYVLGDYGQVAHFDGESWHKQQSPTSEWLFRDAWADAHGLLAVAGNDRLVERSGDVWKVGESTQGLPTDLAGEGAGLTSVVRCPDGEIWAGTDGGSLLVWKDTRWSAHVLREGHAILDLATAGERLFAVGEAGTALVVQRGEPWTEPVGTRRHAALALAGLGEHVWVADDFNLWHYDGERWTPHEGMSRTRALWPVSPTEVHLIGELGYRRFDGQTMHRAELLPHEYFVGHDVWASGSSDVWMAAGEHLMHFDGQGWSAETIEIDAHDIHGSGPDNLLVAGPSKTPRGPAGKVGVWTVARRSGGKWNVEIDSEDRLFIHAHGVDGGVAIERYGNAWLRDASGWHEIASLPKANVANYSVIGVWMHDPTHIWALTHDHGIFRYDGAQWQPERTDMRGAHVLGASERHLLLGNDDGSVVRRWLSTR
jgi:hypothetical protein